MTRSVGRWRTPGSQSRASLLLCTVVILLVLYVLAHSPLRGRIGTLVGQPSPACYFVCLHTLPIAQGVDALSAWALVLCAVGAGWACASRYIGPTYELPLVFCLCAVSFVVVPATFVAVVAEWSGHHFLQPPLGPVWAAVPSVIVIAAAWKNDLRPGPLHVNLAGFQGLGAVFAVLSGGLLFTSIAISLTHPPTGYDALSYHAPMAVYFWREGTLGSFLTGDPTGWALANPGTAEMWFGLLRIAGGEGLADLGQVPFAFLGSFAVYAFARRLRVRHGAAFLAATAFLLAPTVVVESGMQLNDLVAGALLMTSMALAAAPPSSWTNRRLTCISLGLGLAATTKLALLPGVFATALFVLWMGARYYRQETGSAPHIRRLVAFSSPFLIIVLPWWVRNIVLFGNPLFPSALPLMGRGVIVGNFVRKDTRFVPSSKFWLVYPLLERHSQESGYGALFAVGAIPGFLVLCCRRWKGPLMLYCLVAVIMLSSWWALTQHEPRFLLGLFGLGFAFIPWTLIFLRRRRRIVYALLAVAAVFSATVTLNQALIPLSAQSNSRPAFYDQEWGIDPAVLSLPAGNRLVVTEGYAPLSYADDYALLGSDTSRRLVVLTGRESTSQVIAMLHRTGARYAYISAAPQYQSRIRVTYAPSRFALVHTSVTAAGGTPGTRRYLFRLK